MRHFVGIPIPPEIAAALSGVTAGLPSTARSTDPEDLHITLAFLGDVSAHQLPCILAELALVTHPSFPITLSGIDTFPGVIFAGVDRTPDLLALAATVSSRMALCGFRPERRPYHPHVTLARHPRPVPKLDHLTLSPLHFTAASFILYRSRSGTERPRYEHLKHFPLTP